MTSDLKGGRALSCHALWDGFPSRQRAAKSKEKLFLSKNLESGVCVHVCVHTRMHMCIHMHTPTHLGIYIFIYSSFLLTTKLQVQKSKARFLDLHLE